MHRKEMVKPGAKLKIQCCPEQDVVDGEGGWNLISNDGELVVVETLRQEICFSALPLRASKSFSIDRRSRRQTPHLTLFLCVSCDTRIIYHSDFVFFIQNCCIRPPQPVHSTVSIKTLKRGRKGTTIWPMPLRRKQNVSTFLHNKQPIVLVSSLSL